MSFVGKVDSLPKIVHGESLVFLTKFHSFFSVLLAQSLTT